jgi:hypothetical protein
MIGLTPLVTLRSRRFHHSAATNDWPGRQYRRYRSGGARLAVCAEQASQAMRMLGFDNVFAVAVASWPWFTARGARGRVRGETD